jgi:hypothetical protein
MNVKEITYTKRSTFAIRGGLNKGLTREVWNDRCCKKNWVKFTYKKSVKITFNLIAMV